ncbi:MAG: hypothetical protein NXI01_08470 [Gammaproteobacteria bacterium]|nr:hypothetical protein [Gammaproteobacteria bacterium]
MLVTHPFVFLATIVAVFAVVIETEIYLKTIRDALQTLTDPQAYEHQILALYLQEKLKEFDYNRDRLLLTPPTDIDKEKVKILNEILIIRAEDGSSYTMGFRNAEGNYEERVIDDKDLIIDLNGCDEAQFLERPQFTGKIWNMFRVAHAGNPPPRSRDYPLFIKAYVVQLRLKHELSDFLQKKEKHTKVETRKEKMTISAWEAYQKDKMLIAEAKKNRDVMAQHLIEIQKNIVNSLFEESSEISLTQENSELFIGLNAAYQLNFDTMIATPQTMFGHRHFANTKSNELPKSIQEKMAPRSYAFHNAALKKWITPDREAWQPKLPAHRRNARFALLASGLIAATMALGTIYLIVQAVAAIPAFAALSLGLYPITMAMVSIIAGTAYGLMIFSSLYAMLSDNPFMKFYENVRQGYQRDMSLKTKIIFGATVFLGFLTTFLSLCSSLTWLSIFNQTKPVFKVITFIPKVLLNMIIPVFIGLSILPFSIQSISNTLGSLEEHPWFEQLITTFTGRDVACTGRDIAWHFPRSLAELNRLLWDKWVPKFLGISQEEFLAERWQQQVNPWRIFIRLLYEPLKTIIFVGHLLSVGVTADQLDMLPQWLATLLYVWPNTVLELFEDWDYLYGGGHLEKHDTVSLLKDHFQASGGHNHDDNITTRLLNLLFDPIFKWAARWDNHYRPDGAEDSVQKRYEKLRGLDSQTPMPEIPSYRTQGDHKLFLFKSAMSATAPVNDACCQVKIAI